MQHLGTRLILFLLGALALLALGAGAASATAYVAANDFPAGTEFASVTIAGAGYTFSGNAITLGVCGITITFASGTVTFPLDIAPTATARTVTVATGGTLALSGASSGGSAASALTKAGAGTLALSGADTCVCPAMLSAGETQVSNRNALGDGTLLASNATVNATTSLDGTGEVKKVTAENDSHFSAGTFATTNFHTGADTIGRLALGSLTMKTGSTLF